MLTYMPKDDAVPFSPSAGANDRHLVIKTRIATRASVTSLMFANERHARQRRNLWMESNLDFGCVFYAHSAYVQFVHMHKSRVYEEINIYNLNMIICIQIVVTSLLYFTVEAILCPVPVQVRTIPGARTSY